MWNSVFIVCLQISPSWEVPSLSAYHSLFNELGKFHIEFIINRVTCSQPDTHWTKSPTAIPGPKWAFLGHHKSFVLIPTFFGGDRTSLLDNAKLFSSYYTIFTPFNCIQVFPLYTFAPKYGNFKLFAYLVSVECYFIVVFLYYMFVSFLSVLVSS